MARGKNLTVEQKKLIEQYVLTEKWTDKKISEEMGVSIQTIERFRKKMGMKKGPRGNIGYAEDGQPVGKVAPIEKTKISKLDISDQEKVTKMRNFFKGTPRYKNLQKMLMPDQLDQFVERWVEYQISIEDMTPAEEDTLELMIIYKQRIDSNSKAFKESEEQEASIRAQLEDRELNVENEGDRLIFEMINSHNRLKQEINKDLKDLTDKLNVIQRSLNSTREQREARTTVGSDTFLNFVRMLTDKNKRKEIGLLNERIKLSTKMQIQKMKQTHEFADGVQDAILLTSDAVAPQIKESVKGVIDTKGTKNE